MLAKFSKLGEVFGEFCGVERLAMVMGGKFVSREGPAWLPALLECDRFFSHCKFHTTGKNERNQFCFECPQLGALCSEGLATAHRDHASIQIRRASHRDVVRIADIQKYVDLSNIQPYSINSAKIVFLVSQVQPKIVKGAAHYCEMCHRSIADSVRFCSILCKLAGIQEDPHDFTLTLTVSGKSGPGSAEGVYAASPTASTGSLGSGITDFMPQTPNKSKRTASDAASPIAKKSKLALPAVPRLLSREEDVVSSLMPSLMAPLTPTHDPRPKPHLRKQVHPHRAPLGNQFVGGL